MNAVQIKLTTLRAKLDALAAERNRIKRELRNMHVVPEDQRDFVRMSKERRLNDVRHSIELLDMEIEIALEQL